jgi:hypothetical protein
MRTSHINTGTPSRVAFIGNMNNNSFAMARYLRDRGVDCHLFLFPQEIGHFHPSCDTYSLDYQAWTRQLRWGDRRTFLRARSDSLRTELSGFDVRVGCGLAPALCELLGLTLDVLVPYGGDLLEETRFAMTHPRFLRTSVAATWAQRAALRNVPFIHSPPLIASYEDLIRRYCGRADRWSDGVPMVYAPEYAPERLPYMIERSHWGHEFHRIREGCKFMVVSHGRHVWGPQSNPSVKGNDVLLHGWSSFVRQHASTTARLVLLEYGRDVERSKELAWTLGIEDSIVWLPKMLRKDIMPGLVLADVVAGEFVHSWDCGGVIYEALVAKKPIIMHRTEVANTSGTAAMFPVFKASTPEEVASQLLTLAKEPEAGRQAGEVAGKWYHERVARQGTDRYLELLSARSGGRLH